MICPICNAELEENAKECVVCGYHLEREEGYLPGKANGSGRICPVCGANINPEDTICPLCGIFVEVLPETGNTSGKLDTEALEHEEAVEQEACVEQETPVEQETFIEQEIPGKKSKTIRKIVIVILVAVFLLLIGGVIIFVLKDRILNTDNDIPAEPVSEQEQPKEEENDTEPEVEEDTEPITEKAVEPIEKEEAESIRIDDYYGYWYIPNEPLKELKIAKLADDTVLFTLWYYRLNLLKNVGAHLEGNAAYFSTDDDGGAIEGTLIFNGEYIVVQITQSDREYMPAETMVFEIRYDYSPMEEYDVEEASETTLYSVRVSAPPVYIYGGPGYEYGIVGMIADNYEYTIVEEAETYAGDRICLWGRLMSGVGWINIDDVRGGEYGGNPGYILPNSSTMLLTFDDIKDLTSEQLRLARNEIYARHGRKFDDEGIRAYFESQWWYNGIIEGEDFSEDMLSDIERSNTEFIMMHE